MKVAVALKNLKDLGRDKDALVKVVRSVQNLVLSAAESVEDGALGKPAAVAAMQDIDECLRECLDLLSNLARKRTVVWFLHAGDYLPALKGLTSALALKLGALATALGAEQNGDLEQEFEDVRAALVNVKLDVSERDAACTAVQHRRPARARSLPLYTRGRDSYLSEALGSGRRQAEEEAAAGRQYSTLHAAAEAGSVPGVRYHLARSSADDVDARDDDYNTPLYIAAKGGHVEVVEVLLGAGVDKDKHSQYGWTPLVIAAQMGRVEVLKALLRGGADKDKPRSGGCTALHAAAQNGIVEAARVLLAAGADKDKASEDGNTPLHDAAYSGYFEFARVLLAAGANHDARNVRGDTPLHLAAHMGHIEVVRALLDAGANRHSRNEAGHTPYDRAYDRLSIQALLRG